MIDLEALDAEIRARLRSEIPELAGDAPAPDGVSEEMLRAINAPGVFTAIAERSARRKVAELPAQEIELEITIGLVTDDAASPAAPLLGSRGSYQLRQRIKRALQVGWKPATTGRVLKFESSSAAGRKGSRAATEMTFGSSVYENYA